MSGPTSQSQVPPSASWARRFAALFVDWVASTLVTLIFVHDYFSANTHGNLVPLAVFLVESTLFTWLLGGSFGKIATGLRVLPSDGVPRLINPLVVLARQILVAIVIPPLIFRPDGRGLHDLAAGTVTVTKPTFDAAIARYSQQTGRTAR